MRVVIGAAGALACFAGVAHAEEPGAEVEAFYTLDVIGPVSGGVNERGRVLDALDVMASFDLERLAGLRGWSAFVFIESTGGGTPNEDAGTLQGIDNIEVERQRLRLYEAWAERDWGEASLRFGLYDLNSEFNATESAGLLLAPSFGISPEVAGTGPNGPSIFPSTALGARFNYQFDETSYVRFAVLNALAGVPGDPGGVDTSFDDGVLIAGEAGKDGFSLGAWGYSDDQDRISGAGEDRSYGVYAMLERPLNDPDGARATTVFLRLGVSDGETSEVKAGWQGGVYMERAFASRPDSVLSFGVAQAFLADDYRDNLQGGGIDASAAETQFELTYSDTICPHLSIQPDLQYIIYPGGDRDIDNALVAGLRVTLSL